MQSDHRDAFTIPEFCRRHGFSVSHYFHLASKGRGPRVMRAGKRVLISREAGADWRRALEATPEYVPALPVRSVTADTERRIVEELGGDVV